MHIPLNITIPVFNEEACLGANVQRLVEFLTRDVAPIPFEIVIADSGSTDKTLILAEDLARQLDCVQVLHLDPRGRGRALKAAWRQSEARVLSYMDAASPAILGRFQRCCRSFLMTITTSQSVRVC